MLKLTYNRKSDQHQTVTVLSSLKGIADLYWQLTSNYSDTPDGTCIGGIKVTDLDGVDVTGKVMYTISCTRLDKNL